MWPVVFIKPGWSLWSRVKGSRASSRSQSVITTPLSVTVTRQSQARIYWLFHSPSGRWCPRSQGQTP